MYQNKKAVKLNMRRSIHDSSLIVTTNPKSPISEEFRLLRTKISFFAKDQELKTVMVTSSQPGEGKTTTISNLAVTYAQEGKRVLLIDANMRKPSLHRVFSMSNHQGLSTVLAGHIPIHEVIHQTMITNLDLLPSGTIPANPSELLDSLTMREMLEQMKLEYDVILMDTPSVLTVSDSLIVSVLCDGVIMVAAAGKVSRDHLRRAKEQMNHVDARMLGIVVNQMI